jgi:hypothetical protein
VSIGELSHRQWSYDSTHGLVGSSARFGRKRYFSFSALVFVITSRLCGTAGSLVQMVAFPLLQGAAGAAGRDRPRDDAGGIWAEGHGTQSHLLNTLFLQELLGHSPWKSGLAVRPQHKDRVCTLHLYH